MTVTRYDGQLKPMPAAQLEQNVIRPVELSEQDLRINRLVEWARNRLITKLGIEIFVNDSVNNDPRV